MNKELFVKTLTQIQNDGEMANKLSDIFRESKNDFIDGFGFVNEPLTALTVELLEEMCGDTEGWISYWAFALDCGRDWRSDFILDENDNEIPLETIEDLWNILHLDNKEK